MTGERSRNFIQIALIEEELPLTPADVCEAIEERTEVEQYPEPSRKRLQVRTA
jgi:hypothetical protein